MTFAVIEGAKMAKGTAGSHSARTDVSSGSGKRDSPTGQFTVVSERTHVAPAKDGGWGVRKSGAERPIKVFDRKEDAVKYARDSARREGADVYVHKKDGMITEVNSYQPPSKSRK